MRLARRRLTRPTPGLSAVARATADLAAHGPASLRGVRPEPDAPLRIAIVIPGFRRGSGGHTSIASIARGLEHQGHTVSFWLDDEGGGSGGPEAFRSMFGPFAATVAADLRDFDGADVVLATGWQTVPTVMRLEDCAARAYLVQDYEPDFYGASVERRWAEDSYTHGLHCITAGRWLAELVAERYGVTATSFDFGIDQDVYAPRDEQPRSENEVLFYARPSTPRRAVPLGLLALEQLLRTRPTTTVATFGEPTDLALQFPAKQLGVLEGAALADAYREAAVGVVLSLTNYSLVAQEMTACGLPAVELDTPSTRAAFEGSGIELTDATPSALAAVIARLLDDRALRAERGRAGAAWARSRTWDHAAQRVEAGLRTALAEQRA